MFEDCQTRYPMAPIPPEGIPAAAEALEEINKTGTPPEDAAAEPEEDRSAGLIVVTQLPVITQRLRLVKTQIEKAVSDALAMKVTEENRKAAKDQLAELRKGIKALEDQRLAIRREILAPYEEMEAVYRSCVTDVWKPAEAQLSKRITDIESGLISQKRTEVERYFTELCAAHGLDFLRFEDTGVKVLLSVTTKGMKEQCKAFVERVLEDIAMITTHALRAAEILVEYKRNGFNAQRAVIDVNRRMDEADAERARQEQLAARKEAETAAEERVDEAAEAFAPPVQIAPPEEEAPAPEADPVLTIAFRVTAPKSKLIGLREYMKQEGITYGNA